MYFDTHAHYDDPKFKKDLKELFGAMRLDGVVAVVNCASDMKSCSNTLKLTKDYNFVYGAVGVHPHAVKDLDEDDVDRLYNYATQSKKIVAIGEIGLDYHYDFSPRDLQRDWFIEQIELAKELELPIIVHSREAAKDTFDIIEGCDASEVGGIIHSYSGNLEMAREYVDMGFYLGIGGMLTFPDVKKILRVVEEIPLERLLLETDAPYLSPVPKRGQRNDSRNLKYVAERIAQLKGITAEEVEKVTTENACRVFNIKLQTQPNVILQ